MNNRLQIILETVSNILSEENPQIWLSSMRSGRPKGETKKPGLTRRQREALVDLAMQIQRGNVPTSETETPKGILKSAAKRMVG